MEYTFCCEEVLEGSEFPVIHFQESRLACL